MDPVDVGDAGPDPLVRPEPLFGALSPTWLDGSTNGRSAGGRPAPGEGGLAQWLRALIWGADPGGADPLVDLIREHREFHPDGDVAMLRRAYVVAERAHRGQFRKSGEPYISHPLAVTRILSHLGMDTTALAAGLLHDTVEDTDYTLASLKHDFGAEVAAVVDGVTKMEKVSYGADAEAETIRKMILAAGRDVRVLVVKLADRLHNMRTLDARSPSSQARIAAATLDVLVPLCDRLGIQALKRELEDVVLFYLHPDAYGRIQRYVHNRPLWAVYLNEVSATARTALKREKVEAEVIPRPRHFYSIWKDTVAGGHVEPFDLPRLVIIVDGPDTDCYAALGAVHGTWRPVLGRFKDFIASPKNNLYRSLHTTVIGPADRTVEILIRTKAMHRFAEYGIAAQYRYARFGHPHLLGADATGNGGGDGAAADHLPWLRRVLEWEREAPDPVQFLDALHRDLAEGQIQVFTKSGRKVLLPVQSTPVDLAYVLDTALGDNCVAALINGRLAPLSSALRDGDVVDVLTRQDTLPGTFGAGRDPGRDLDDEADGDAEFSAIGPSQEWLSFVRTPHARLQISRWFIDHDPDQPVGVANKVRLGRAALGLALRRRDRALATDAPLLRLADRLGHPDLESLLVAVAEHQLPAESVVEDLIALVDHGPA